MLDAYQQAHLDLRKKRKKRPLSPRQMKKVFAEEIQGLILEISLVDRYGDDSQYLKSKLITLRDMRVKLGLGQYIYRDELLKGVID